MTTANLTATDAVTVVLTRSERDYLRTEFERSFDQGGDFGSLGAIRDQRDDLNAGLAILDAIGWTDADDQGRGVSKARLQASATVKSLRRFVADAQEYVRDCEHQLQQSLDADGPMHTGMTREEGIELDRAQVREAKR